MAIKDWIYSPEEWGSWGRRANNWFDLLKTQVNTNTTNISSIDTDVTALEANVVDDGTDLNIVDGGEIRLKPDGLTGTTVYFAEHTTGEPALFVEDGTTAKPAITWEADDNTGIYRYGANEVAIASGGGESARFNATRLHLGANTTTRGIKYAGTNGTGSSNDMGFKWSSPNMYCRVDNAVEAIIGTVSDERLKDNVVGMPPGTALKRLARLRPVDFDPMPLPGDEFESADPYRRPGLIAQEVEEHEPWAVPDVEGDEYKTVDYNGMVPLLVKAVQELSERVQYLEDQLSK